jgi:hypothetical protein
MVKSYIIQTEKLMSLAKLCVNKERFEGKRHDEIGRSALHYIGVLQKALHGKEDHNRIKKRLVGSVQPS